MCVPEREAQLALSNLVREIYTLKVLCETDRVSARERERGREREREGGLARPLQTLVFQMPFLKPPLPLGGVRSFRWGRFRGFTSQNLCHIRPLRQLYEAIHLLMKGALCTEWNRQIRGADCKRRDFTPARTSRFFLLTGKGTHSAFC